MPVENTSILQSLLDSVLGKAQQRPDLLSERTGGPSFGSPDYRPTGQQGVATMFGRVVKPGDTIESVIARFPIGETESGASALEAIKSSIPIAIWKGMSPQSKASLTQFANNYPVTMEKILKHPQPVTYNVTGGIERGRLGSHTRLGSDADIVQIGTQYQKDLQVPRHEFTHYLNAERMGKATPDDASTIGHLLTEQIQKAGYKPSSALGPKQFLSPEYDIAAELGELIKIPKKQFDDYIKLTQAERSTHYNSGNFPHQQRYGIPGSSSDMAKRVLGEEGMAHLAQFAGNKDAPSILKLLAERLGILAE